MADDPHATSEHWAVDQLVAERDALQAEVEQLKDQDVVPGSLAQRFKDERNIARVRVEQLERALREYGQHKGTCSCRTGPGRMCDCGLDEGLRETA